jgi:hypothetical protein
MPRFLIVLLSWFSPASDVDACVAFWQERLRLQDWTIRVRVVSAQELGGRANGDIEIDAASQTAVLRVLRLEDSDLPRRLARADQQYTVAHEMVHLYRFVQNDPGWRNEKVIDTHTVALARKHRRWQELLAVEK